MKKIYLLFIIGMVNLSSAQTFSLKELVDLSSTNFEEFDTKVLKKNFQFNRTETEPEKSEIVFYSLNPKPNNRADKWIYLIDYKDKNEKLVAFQTFDKNDYLRIKEQITINGFKYTERLVSDDNAVFLDYRKNNLELSLVSYIAKNKKGEEYNSYEISIINIQ